MCKQLAKGFRFDYLKVPHAYGVDDGAEEKFQHDQRVDSDADDDARFGADLARFDDAVVAVDDEPYDDWHPTDDARSDDQQSCDDGLLFF